MRDSAFCKRFLSLVLVAAVFLGIVICAPEEIVNADADEAFISLSDAASNVSDEFTAGNGIYKVYTNASVAFMGLVDPNVTSFSVPTVVTYRDKKYNVTWIAQSAFEGNTTIQKIYVGKKVNTICSRAFAGCTSLTSVTGGRSVVYTADDAYDNCPSYKKPGRYYPRKIYNVGLRYTGRYKPWRSKKVKAGKNGKGEMTWITDEDLKALGMTRESFSNSVLAACRKMSGTKYSDLNNCLSYCLSAYAKALGVASSVSKGRDYKIKFTTGYKKNSKTRYAVNLMSEKKLVSANGRSVTRHFSNWFHCTYFAERMLKKPDCYGGVRVSDYASLGDCMKALHAQRGDIVLFGGYVVTYLCKDGRYHYNPHQGGGKKKNSKGKYVTGEGGLFLWGHAAIYCGQDFTHVDSKGRMRSGQWFYENFKHSKAGLHWREPYYYAGKTNVRVMVIHIGNPAADTEEPFADPVRKTLGKDAVTGKKYGFYRSEEDAARDYNRLCTYTCGATYDIPEIYVGSASKYDIDSKKRISARFYIRQLTDSGTLDPDQKPYLFLMRASDAYDLPKGWVSLAS